jgi:single-stranded-DNA-specific exonuclease
MAKTIKRYQPDTERNQFSDDINPLLQNIYLSRNVCSDDDIATDMSGLLKPSGLKGIDTATALISLHLQKQNSILIIGDFDADGATSSALSVLVLHAMGAENIDFLVPNRFEYGYGLTPEIVAVAAKKNPQLIITVDNGIASIDGVDAANKLGIDVLITDHHLPAHSLPDAAAIVNPNQPGCEFASKAIAGVGVIFYVLSALRSLLREQGWFEKNSIAEPNMGEYLDLVALGTVADVVSLDKNNRILVEQGLKRMRAGRTRPGIKALLEIANRNLSRVVSSDLGFTVGPRLNAAGRLDDMSLGIDCLITTDEYLAREMASQLNDLNFDRKAIEAGMQQEAMKSLQALEVGAEGNMPYGLCLFDENWHQGVIGILASRIKDRYHRPVIAFAPAEQSGMIKGSARSIKGLHIRDVLDAVAAKHPDVLEKFGGHAMAAGMTITLGSFEKFTQAFDEEVRRQLSEDDLQQVIHSDGELSESQFNLELAKLLRDAGPWGQNFSEPVFDGVFKLIQQRIVGKKHLKMVLALDDNAIIDAIAFNVDVKLWPNEQVEQVRLAYKLDVNEYKNRESVQLLVDYIEPLLEPL